MEKLSLRQQKHTFTVKRNVLKHKKLKPGLVASYNIRPGNGEGLFWFQCFIICHLLTYLDTYPLTYSPGTHMGFGKLAFKCSDVLTEMSKNCNKDNIE